MTMLQSLPLSALLAGAAVAGLIVGGLLAALVLGGRGKRETGTVIASIQAERDALRAAHAVEVTRLESRLLEANERLDRDAGAALRLTAAEATVAALRGELAAAKSSTGAVDTVAAAAASERETEAVTGLRDELASLAERLRHAEAEREAMREAEASLIVERDEAVTARNAQAEELVALRRTLAEQASGAEDLPALRAERDALKAELNQVSADAAALREAVDGLAEAPATGELGEREAVEALERTLAARDATIAELRAGAKAAAADGEAEIVTGLRAALGAAEAREAAANESLSRLAYDREGLESRLQAAERRERAARAEVERREAMLELRLQTIHDLEEQLRTAADKLEQATRRAEAAEQGGGDAGAEDAAPDLKAELHNVLGQLEEAREQNARLGDEIELLRAASTGADADDGPAGDSTVEKVQAAMETQRAEIATLRSENQALREKLNGAAGVTLDDLATLKAELRALAEAFAAPPAETRGEPSLAERIRAYKAAKDAAKTGKSRA